MRKFKFNIFNSFILVVVLLTIGFLVINISAIYKQISYIVKNRIDPHYINIEQQINLTAEANRNIANKNNYLIIPKISLQTPIIWNISEQNSKEILTKNIVGLDTSSKPNETTANVILLGNSSLPWWLDQGGGTLFALISKLEIGDRININYMNDYYVYQVKNKQIIKTDQVFLNQAKDGQRLLTLITYYPIGINNNRLLVNAELISTSNKK